MVPGVLKETLVPGSPLFFLMAATVGVLLLYRKTHNGRAGRVLLSALVLAYWVLSMPVTAVPLIRAMTADDPPLRTRADGRGATAIVVLGGGMETYHSRGVNLQIGTREHSLRVIEAARVYHLLDRPWVVVSGSSTSAAATESEAAHIAAALRALGVPGDRIVEESQSLNTRDHTTYVPPLLAERGVGPFVLVTSRQHMARARRAFRAVGLDPIPSSPEFHVYQGGGPLEPVIPSKGALQASAALMYDLAAMVYYRVRGWA